MLFLILNAVHVLLSLAMFSSAYCATTANVVDPYIEERGFPTPTMSMKEFQDKYYSALQNKELCWCKHCNWYVHRNAKHCRACNRCTVDFDHHCRWLNNCISAQNYHQFFAAVISTESLLLYEVTVGILMLCGQIPVSQHLFIRMASPTLLYSLIALHIVVACFMAIPNGQLIIFHIYLHRKQISTYEWVVSREQEKMEKEQERSAQKQQKRASMIDAIPLQENNENPQNTFIHSMGRVIRKYIHSLRDCQQRHQRKHPKEPKGSTASTSLPSTVNQDIVEFSHSSKAPQGLLSVDTNADVKLSGLSTNGSTEEMDVVNGVSPGPIILEEATPPTSLQLFCASLSKCNWRPFRMRNRVQPPQDRHKRYSNDKEDDITNETEDVIFGPDNAQSSQIRAAIQMSAPVPLEEVTDDNV